MVELGLLDVYHIVWCHIVYKSVCSHLVWSIGNLRRLKVIVLVESRPARNVIRMQQGGYAIDAHLDADYVRKPSPLPISLINLSQSREEPNALSSTSSP